MVGRTLNLIWIYDRNMYAENLLYRCVYKKKPARCIVSVMYTESHYVCLINGAKVDRFILYTFLTTVLLLHWPFHDIVYM